ncbi:MAG: hypothetical protein JO235_26895 [Chroococcidiopsidaceae cyanobacterium CP_BM_RX_35]|nr:hypothetical protein [Chroococcidiopsidaceae cyanobacterium CP_BM_RX_35]
MPLKHLSHCRCFHIHQASNRQKYREFITKNANSVWAQSLNHANQFGLCWEGAFDSADAIRQSSAMDAINAALALSTDRKI